MLKVYGSPFCPDCRNCTMNFDLNHIPYRYFDILAGLAPLREFLKMRDSDPVFDRLKAVGDIGIPAIVGEDGEIFTDWEGYLKEKGLPITYEETGEACSLDHRNC